MKRIKNLVLFLEIALVVSLTGCFIDEVSQPSEVNAGETFTATITISDMNAEQSNAHKGAIAILVPEDWSFESGTYSASVGFGNLEIDTLSPPAWGDVDTLIERPDGMKWINLLTDKGYLHNANMVYEATVNLKVGQKAGDYAIGYLVTVNTMDMLKFLNDLDEDQQLAGADTSMNHMVKVIGSSAVEERTSDLPKEFQLSQNYPNPFNPTTTFEYSLKQPGDVQIGIFDASGKEIKSLVDGYRSAGSYKINFDASSVSNGLPSGIYYYRISTPEFTQTKKMILLK